MKIIELGGSKISKGRVRNKESPDIATGMRFNELGMRRTGFYTISESTLDDGEDSFNNPPFTVQSNYTAEQPSKGKIYPFQGFVATPLLIGLKIFSRYPYNPKSANKTWRNFFPLKHLPQNHSIVPRSFPNVFSQNYL